MARILGLSLSLALAACGGGGGGSGTPAPVVDTPSAKPIASFARGADVGWVSAEEAAGYRFRDAANNVTDAFALLQGSGINAVRLRVWVNPADGWNGLDDVLAKARRAAALGQRIMIDFHYSDTWADPGHQTKPAAWASHDYAALKNDVYTHTRDVLSALKAAGIAVEWVQVGNEINSGMLWPDGSYQHFDQLAGLINSGYTASHEVYPEALVVLHLANGYDDGLYRWFFDAVKTAGAKWDAIGMSHYPPTSGWLAYNQKIGATMADVVARYGKPVLVTEVGMDRTQAATARAMITDLIGRVAAQGSNGLGVFYWEPLAWPGWQGYTMGALDESGKLTEAMKAFVP
ncbi:arabinogalactan endo-1,4-beta-galactosidase [Niveibacterium umoris]|uniref:glycoside hydrolase family 53 protein n=1 Tax=Niveibacterium umoris TaxID=1193620 RepID=UPI0030B81DA2